MKFLLAVLLSLLIFSGAEHGHLAESCEGDGRIVIVISAKGGDNYQIQKSKIADKKFHSKRFQVWQYLSYMHLNRFSSKQDVKEIYRSVSCFFCEDGRMIS